MRVIIFILFFLLIGCSDHPAVSGVDKISILESDSNVSAAEGSSIPDGDEPSKSDSEGSDTDLETAIITKQWGTSKEDEGRSVAVDSYGDIYVTGYSYGALGESGNFGHSDIILSKRNSRGDLIWTRQWGTNGDDSGNSVAVDGDGNIYVTGYTSGSLEGHISGGSWDIFLTKLTPDGELEWTSQWGTDGVDEGNSVAVDPSGNIYVAGSVSGSGSEGYSDIFLAKFSAEGEMKWRNRWGTDEADAGNSVAVDLNGDIYVTGVSKGVFAGKKNAGHYDNFLTRLNLDGRKEWTHQWGTSGEDSAHSVVTDQFGNIYVAGGTYGSFEGRRFDSDSDVFLTRFMSDGRVEWTRQWGTSGYDKGSSVAVGQSGNIYVTGYSDGDLEKGEARGELDIYLSILPYYDIEGDSR